MIATPHLSPVPEAPAARRAALEEAIIQAVVYSDLFDYPLTAAEIHRSMVGVAAELAEVTEALAGSPLLRELLTDHGRYYALAGREHTVALRERRAAVASERWPVARRYGALIARLPFVRMVAVTGALAVDNVEPSADIDYLIVTEPGRLWLCRGLVIGLVRLAARRGYVICPNYFLSERALVLDERSLYTAHELVQMVPLAGMGIYQDIRLLNRWSSAYLPNASEPRLVGPVAALPRPGAQTLAELALRTPLGGRVERWEMRRKIRKLSGQRADRAAVEANFSAECCKGHFEGYGQRMLAAFERRMAQIEELKRKEPV